MRWVGLIVIALAGCSPEAKAPEPAAATVAAAAPVLVEDFDATQIIRLVGPMDYKPAGQIEASSDANAAVDFRGPEGETFRAEARHCASHRPGVKCAGITLTARIMVPGMTAADLLNHANGFNKDQAAVFMFEDDGDLVVSDDVILDGGISEVNLEASLEAFSTVLRQNRDLLLRASGARP